MTDRKALKIAIERSSIEFLEKNVALFVKNKDISQMSVTNEYGAVILCRNTDKQPTKIVGFAVGGEECIEDTDYSDDDEDDDHFDEGGKVKCKKRK